MKDFTEKERPREVIKSKLRQFFDGKIVRKDLTKKSKKEQMFPSMYWSSFLDSIVHQMILVISKSASNL